MVAAFVDGGLHQGPPRHQHGLRRRERRAARRDHRRARRRPRRARPRRPPMRDAFAPPVYVIGTEVPVPGGALEALDHLAGDQPRGGAGDGRGPPRRLRRPRPRGGLRPRHRRRRPARRRVRQRGRHRLRAGEGPRAERRADGRCRSSSSRRIRPTTSRPRRWRPWSQDGFAILKVGPGPDLRAARGALRARPHRRRPRGPPRRRRAAARRWSA